MAHKKVADLAATIATLMLSALVSSALVVSLSQLAASLSASAGQSFTQA